MVRVASRISCFYASVLREVKFTRTREGVLRFVVHYCAMKTLTPFRLVLLICTFFAAMAPGRAQDVITSVDCELHGLVCNVCSQPSTMSLYHPGPYLTWPPATNVLEWEFTDSEGNILHQETLVDASTVSFSFDLPLTDTLHVSVLHTNDSVFHNGSAYPWACLVEDYLTWEIYTYPNGTEYGSWTLGGSAGVDVSGPATCVDSDLIDPSVFCAEIYEPVCGCDGVTYSNACLATYTGGVTSWEEGPCIVIENEGCTYGWACNFDSSATVDDGSCEIESCGGCTVPEAINYDPEALIDDGSCQVNVVDESCQADLNGDGIVTAGDLLQFLAAFGLACN